MARKPKIPNGCHPKEISSKSISLLSNKKRFKLTDKRGLWSWRHLKIAPFNQGDSPSCWAVVVCRAIQAYLNIYGTTFRATSMQFSPQCLIDCLACIIRDQILPNWYPEDKSYSYGTFQGLCFAAKYGIAALKDYEFNGKMLACKEYKPIVAPISVVSLKMYEESFCEKRDENLSKNKWELKEENLKIGFNQTITEDMEVASDEKIIGYLKKSPMLGTFQCFNEDYPKYKGKRTGIYYGPKEFKRISDPYDEPTYHAVVVTGYKWDVDRNLVLEVHTSNDDFGKGGVGYISRHLFIAMESVELVSPKVETSDDIYEP
ncbi:hypothetical protein P8452_34740 [Trifolium repens]|nr:hypothetical protein P8452_34740 [Trifolium repens]